MTIENAEFYHGVLNQKLHKMMKLNLKKQELAKEREQLAAQNMVF